MPFSGESSMPSSAVLDWISSARWRRAAYAGAFEAQRRIVLPRVWT